jgi:hypothetical protein
MTKAEEFKARAQIAAHDRKPKRAAKRKRAHAGRRVERFADDTMNRNAKGKAERRGGAELEASATGKPSRKSTRGSIDHTKRTTSQQNRATMRQARPSTRATARRH